MTPRCKALIAVAVVAPIVVLLIATLLAPPDAHLWLCLGAIVCAILMALAVIHALRHVLRQAEERGAHDALTTALNLARGAKRRQSDQEP